VTGIFQHYLINTGNHTTSLHFFNYRKPLRH
jgi:hypothetical protein